MVGCSVKSCKTYYEQNSPGVSFHRLIELADIMDVNKTSTTPRERQMPPEPRPRQPPPEPRRVGAQSPPQPRERQKPPQPRERQPPPQPKH